MATFVIAYDITEDRRRERAAAVLLRYGRRIQFSVFVAELDSEEHRDLRQALGPILSEHDALEMFPVDTRDPDRWVSWRTEPSRREPVIVVG